MRAWRSIGLVLLIACTSGRGGVDDLRALPHQSNAGVDWRDQVIYQIMVDRFANGDPNNDINVAPTIPGRWRSTAVT